MSTHVRSSIYIFFQIQNGRKRQAWTERHVLLWEKFIHHRPGFKIRTNKISFLLHKQSQRNNRIHWKQQQTMLLHKVTGWNIRIIFPPDHSPCSFVISVRWLQQETAAAIFKHGGKVSLPTWLYNTRSACARRNSSHSKHAGISREFGCAHEWCSSSKASRANTLWDQTFCISQKQ